jgi:hypothetical protein
VIEAAPAKDRFITAIADPDQSGYSAARTADSRHKEFSKGYSCKLIAIVS